MSALKSFVCGFIILLIMYFEQTVKDRRKWEPRVSRLRCKVNCNVGLFFSLYVLIIRPKFGKPRASRAVF